MAPRTTKTTREGHPSPDDIEHATDAEFESTPDPADEDNQLDLQNLLADLNAGDGSMVSVFKQTAGKQLSWITSFTASEMDISQLFPMLKFDHNGGLFRLQVRANGRLVKNKAIRIEPPTPRERMEMKQYESQETTLATLLERMENRHQDNSLPLILQMMNKQNENFQAMMLAIVKAQQPAPVQAGPSLIELVTAMAQLKQLTSDDKPRDSQIDLLLKGVELAREMGGSDRETNMFDVLAKSLGAFGGTLSKAMETAIPPQTSFQPQQIPSQQTMQPNPAVQTAQPPQHNVQAQPVNALPDEHPFKQYEQYAMWLYQLAATGRDPFTYAGVIVDQLGTDTARQLFTDRTVLAQIFEAFPYLSNHTEWFAELVREIDALTSPDDDGEHAPSPYTITYPEPHDGPIDGTAARPGGDAGDVADDESLRDSGKNIPQN